MNEQSKHFHGSKLRILTGCVIRAFLVFLLLWTIRDFSSFLFSGSLLLYKLEKFLTLPTLFVLGSIPVLIYLIPKIRTVTVDKTSVTIRQGFRKTFVFPLASYAFVPHKKPGSKWFKNEYLYLRIEKENEKPILFELPFYSKETYSAMFSAIHAAGTHAMPASLRSEIAYENLQAGELTFQMPLSDIRKAEWKRFACFTAVVLVVAAVMFFLRKEYVILIEYLFLLLSCVLPISIPIEAVRMMRNLARCPKTIRRHGTFLYFDEQRFSVNEIDKIILTDVNAVSKSIYPLNRYIQVYAGEKKYIYWAGSAGALSKPEYTALCSGIEQVFINAPEKIIYKQD